MVGYILAKKANVLGKQLAAISTLSWKLIINQWAFEFWGISPVGGCHVLIACHRRFG